MKKHSSKECQVVKKWKFSVK